MRILLLTAAAALALAGCKNNDQHDNNMNVDENLTAANIVSNDVTAIDAVTGDAANMAADVDTNFGTLETNGPANESKPSRPVRETSSSATETNGTANATTNAVANRD